MTEPTNTTRAARAKATLEAYAALYGEVVEESTITDLLGDLHHYLRAEGYKTPRCTMDEYMNRAVCHYQEESREEA